MTPLTPTSLDITSENLAQLKALFPNVFSEGKIDFDVLKAELGEHLETDGERYQFTWNGKAQAKRIATTPSMGTLRPAVDESVNWDSTENLYIEGDNLEVLKLLQKAYFGKVKMIYIDPPYNTGKDFVYKDDFKDNLSNYKRLTKQVDDEGNPLTTNSDSSGRYHSNWLNMMYPRLKLARNLLLDDGVIFISIDDNEVHNLRKLCDEIFWEDNFLAEFIWEKRTNRENRKIVSSRHDYIVSYAKLMSPEVKPITQIPMTDKALANYKNPDNDPNGLWKSDPATAHAVMQLNADDGGNRKFILVQIPEATPEGSEARKEKYLTIAEIGKERIRRAGRKIQADKPDTKADLGFKVFKLDTSNIKAWNPTPDTLQEDLLHAVDNILVDRTDEDLLYEVLIKYGLPLTLPIETVQLGQHTGFSVGMGSLVGCFAQGITLETVQAIADMSTPENPVLRVVFRDSGFADDNVKTNAVQRLKQAGVREEDVVSV
jgi:hypothetical protein